MNQLELSFSEPEAVDLHEFAEKLLAETLAKFPLERPVKLLWKNYRTTAGMADYREHAIYLSKNLLITPDRLRDTLLHEFAHLLAFQRHGRSGAGHGKPWKQAMADLGLEARVHHQYECKRNQVRNPHLYTCNKCGAIIPRRRRLRRFLVYFHVGCGGKIVKLRQTKGKPTA